MKSLTRTTVLFLLVAQKLLAQNTAIEKQANAGLKMTFPGIYFKLNSTDYAAMPYRVNKCFEYIASNFNANKNDLVIWRDSLETEKLTSKRIKKLSSDLKKYLPNKKIHIHSMGHEQRIARTTILAAPDSTTRNYLISLNSVFELSQTRLPLQKKKKMRHYLVWTGWKHGFHWSD